MRTYTILVSIAAHVCAASALLFTTVLATAELPAPHDASTFVNVVTVVPAAVPPPSRPRPVEHAPTNALAPFAAPEGIHTETELLTPDVLLEPIPAGVVGGFGVEGGLLAQVEPPPPPPSPVKPIRVGGVVEPPRKIVHVAPVYPELARAAHVSGVVILEASIDERGEVHDARVLRSIPLLDRAAIDAVRQWRFTPTVLNGQVIPVVMTVTVNFKLD